MQSPNTSVDRATRTERLAELLRLDIIKGVLRAGSRFTEEGLAEQYGVSRTPVREALRLLERESLLVYLPRTGYLVRTVNLDEMEDLYAVRISIEERSATRIVRDGSHAALSELLAFWSQEPASAADGDMSLVYADEHFHHSLAVVSGSTVLPDMLRTINDRLHALRMRDFVDPQRVHLTFEQHASIVRSLLDGNASLAVAQLRAHILESHTYVRQHFTESEQHSE